MLVPEVVAGCRGVEEKDVRAGGAGRNFRDHRVGRIEHEEGNALAMHSLDGVDHGRGA